MWANICVKGIYQSFISLVIIIKKKKKKETAFMAQTMELVK